MKNKHRKFALITALVMSVSMAMTACGDDDSKDDDDEDETPKYEQPVESYLKAIQNGSGSDFKKSIGKEQAAYIEENLSDDYFDTYAKELREDAEDQYGENLKITYKVKDKEKIDKEDLEDYESEYESKYDADVTISEGYELETTVKLKGKDDSDEDDMTFTVVKIDSKWVIYDIK